jgi:hypothetical protein
MLIPGPEPIQRRYGLFTAASGPVHFSTPHGRGGGVRYAPVSCGEAHPYPIGCYEGDVQRESGLIQWRTGDAPTKPRDPDNGEVDTGVFAVVASIECGTVGYTAAEDAERVRRRLRNGEQGAVEYALWTGIDQSGNDLDILNLSETAEDIFITDPDTLVELVSALEDYAYRDQNYGHTAFIHAPVSVSAWAAEANLVLHDGKLQRTPYGSIWVFGGGYPGTGESASNAPVGGAYVHITGQVQVWASPDEFIYPVDQTMDKAHNQRLLIAEREYSVGFECFNGRAEFDPLGGVS